MKTTAGICSTRTRYRVSRLSRGSLAVADEDATASRDAAESATSERGIVSPEEAKSASKGRAVDCDKKLAASCWSVRSDSETWAADTSAGLEEEVCQSAFAAAALAIPGLHELRGWKSTGQVWLHRPSYYVRRLQGGSLFREAWVNRRRA